MLAMAMGPRAWMALALALLAQLGGASARNDDVEITVSRAQPWVYLGKFGFGIGNASTIKGTVSSLDDVTKERTKGSPWVLLYCDVEWADVLEMPVTTYEECEKKRKVAREGAELVTGWTPRGSNGAMWKEVTGFDMKIFQSSRPYVWFAAFCDCSRLPGAPDEKQVPAEVVSKHKVQITYLQTDGGHLPCDEFGLPTLYLFCTLGLMGYAVFYFMQLQRHQSTTGQIHPVTACIGIVLLLQWLAMLFEQVHLWSLESSGKGGSFSNGVSHLLSWLATSFMTAVLVLIGFGWTITSDSLGHMLSSTLAGPGLLAVYGIKALVLFFSFLGVIDSVDHAMYHDYENRGGQLVAFLQFAVWGLFLHGCSQVAKQRGHDNQLMAFLTSLKAYGSVFILAVPAVVTIASVVIAPYVRHRFVTIGTLLIQLAGITGFAQLCFTRSAYFKLSTLGRSQLGGI